MNLYVSINYNIAYCANFCNKKIEKLTKQRGRIKINPPAGPGEKSKFIFINDFGSDRFLHKRRLERAIECGGVRFENDLMKRRHILESMIADGFYACRNKNRTTFATAKRTPADVSNAWLYVYAENRRSTTPPRVIFQIIHRAGTLNIKRVGVKTKVAFYLAISQITNGYIFWVLSSSCIIVDVFISAKLAFFDAFFITEIAGREESDIKPWGKI